VRSDIVRQWPLSHLHSLPTLCESKTTVTESFDSTCVQLFYFEICLHRHIVPRSTGPLCSQGFLHRSVAKLSAVVSSSASDPPYSFLTLTLALSKMSAPTTRSVPLHRSRRASNASCPAIWFLGFAFMGPITIVGPFPLRPKPIFCDPSPLPIKPRFVSFCNLQSLSQCRRRFSVLSGHGHHLNGESPSLLCSCKQSLRTLVLGLCRAMLYVCFLKSLGLVLMRPICRRCDAGHQSPLSKYFMPTSISTNFKNIPTIFPSRVWIKLPDYKLCVEFLNLLGRYGLLVREDPPVLLRYRINLSTPRRSFSLYQNLVRTFAKALLSVVLLVPTRLLSLAPLLTLLRLVTVTTFSLAALFVEVLSTILDLTSTKLPPCVWFIALLEFLLIYFICVFAFLLMVLANAYFCYLLNFGILESSFHCTCFYLSCMKTSICPKKKQRFDYESLKR